MRLNSIANYFIELTDKNDFIELHKFIKVKNLPVLIIGEGTNVVLPDIFEGIVVKPNFNEIDGGLKITEITSKINNILRV